MGFKMSGSPAKMGTISGTAGHRSALKMASTVKIASPAKSAEYDAAAKKDAELGSYVKNRKAIKAKYGGDRTKYRASDEYKANQSKINKAYGIDDGYKAPEKKVEAAPVVKAKTKTEKKIAKVVTKGEKKKSEVTENVDKKTAKLTKRQARKKYGKDSKEFLEAKATHLKAKETDRQGGKGGKKQGIFRKWSSNINKNRQEKNKAKLKAKQNDEDAAYYGSAEDKAKNSPENAKTSAGGPPFMNIVKGVMGMVGGKGGGTPPAKSSSPAKNMKTGKYKLPVGKK